MLSKQGKFLALLAVMGAFHLLAAGVASAQSGDSSTDTGSGSGTAGSGTSAASPSSSAEDKIDADIKGMVGLGLIGAELGFVIPAAAGMRDAWAYIVFPIVGAAGGAVGGYLIFDSGGGSPELAVAMLVTGMALIIPSTVITLSLTAYDPETDEAFAKADLTGSSRKGRASALGKAAMARRAGSGLLRWSPEGIFLAPPAITPVLRLPERERGQPISLAETELRVTMLSGRF